MTIIEITKEKINPQTKEKFVTLSWTLSTKHIILRLEKGLKIEKLKYEDADDSFGMLAHFKIKRE